MDLDNRAGVHSVGHRLFVGGRWDEIGPLQFDFMKAQGLEPHHTFIDVACGSLRGGHHFINYLEPDRYLGIDKHIELIIYGVAAEVGLKVFTAKRPRFVVSDRFEFFRLDAQPEFGIAQSLFTHLVLPDVVECLQKLRAVAAPGCRFFPTFIEPTIGEEWENPPTSHADMLYKHWRSEIEEVADKAGWRPRYIGDWGHPGGQVMIELIAY